MVEGVSYREETHRLSLRILMEMFRSVRSVVSPSHIAGTYIVHMHSIISAK